MNQEPSDKHLLKGMLNGKRGSLYITAGAMAEKCVSGRLSSKSQNSSYNNTEKPLQFSVFGGAGLQVDLSQHIGLFVEPLVTCYIDNHSSVNNIIPLKC